MPIVINQNVSQVAAQVAAQGAAATPATVVLQPGSVISARVLQVLASNTVQIAIGGQALEVQSQVPLQAGQTLQLAVSQTSDGIRLAIVDQQATAAPGQGSSVAANGASDTVTLAPDAAASMASLATSAVATPAVQLTPQEVLAVATAAQAAATQQGSLATLFADLGVAAGLNSLPQPLQQAIAQVLTRQLSLDQNLTGQDIQRAFQSSGLFLEASLASGSVPTTSTPDLKAALIVLRQVLTTSLASATATPAATTTVNGSATSVVPQQAAAVATAAQTQAATTSQAAQQPFVVVTPATTQAAAVLTAGATLVATILEQGTQPTVQATLQPVAITVVADTPVTVSPSLVPQLAEAALSQVPVTTASTPATALNLNALSALISPSSTATDATALAAATSAALTQLQEAVQSGPLTGANLSRLVFNNGAMMSLLAAATRPSHVDDADSARANAPPPPIRGALPTAQAVVPATLVTNTPVETALHHLAADLDGAIARQTLLQVASLPDRVDATGARPDTGGPRWSFEIPFMTPRGTTIAQFEISRDDNGNGSESEAASRVWRARFSLNVEPAGPVHAVISLSGERTSVRMWAERPVTAAQLRAGAGELNLALSRADLVAGDIVIRDGTPPQAAPARAGHFLDRAL